MDITITINSPDLVAAASVIASAILDSHTGSKPEVSNPPPVTQPVPETFVQEHQIDKPQSAPAKPAPAPTPAPMPNLTAPTTPAPTPTPAKPKYTFDQICRTAGAMIDSDPNARTKLKELCARNYGIASLKDLKPEMYDAFAADLQLMGAQIKE